MSLTNALNSATSGLLAQSKALASISSNVANSSTTGYKSTSTTFESFLNKKNTVDEDTGGVRAYNYRNISAQGDIQSTTTTTNMAVDGNGFFVVSDKTTLNGEADYSRNGSFSADKNGYLVNSEGYYLYGWELDDSGNIKASNSGSTESLTAINVADIKGTPKATSSVSIAANLPSDAVTGASFTSDLEVFDSMGNGSSITLTWTKTADNTWTMNAANPVSASDSTKSTGTIASGLPKTITFDSDGKLSSISPSGSVSIDWTGTGATSSSINFDLGTVGKTDGLTQYASDETTPTISDITTTPDGYSAGSLKSTSIDEDGVVTAKFSNGETRAIYKIPIATFANSDGLNSVSGSVFTQTTESGNYQLRAASEGGAGKVKASALEGSTVELTDEFSRMIMTQQAYTAASKVVTTADEMLDTLIQLKR